MSTWKKTILCLGLCLLVIGGGFTAAGWFMGGETNVTVNVFGYPISVGSIGMGYRHTNLNSGTRGSADDRALEAFDTIEIAVAYADVVFEESETYGVALEWHHENYEMNYEVRNGMLRVTDARHMNGFNMGNIQKGTVTVYLPKDAKLGEVTLNTGMGKIALDNWTMNRLTIDNDMGDVELRNLQCQLADLSLDMGKLSWQGGRAEDFVLNNSMGSVELGDASFGDMDVELDMGDLKVFDCTMESGSWYNSLGRIEGTGLDYQSLTVTNACGDIDLTGALRNTEAYCDLGAIVLNTSLEEPEFDYYLSTDLGNVKVDGDRQRGEKADVSNRGSAYTVTAENDCGEVRLNFGV